MALPHGGIGGLNIDAVDAQNSGLDLFANEFFIFFTIEEM